MRLDLHLHQFPMRERVVKNLASEFYGKIEGKTGRTIYHLNFTRNTGLADMNRFMDAMAGVISNMKRKK